MFGLAFAALRFSFYVFSFFFFFHAFSPSQAATVHVRYINSSRNIWPVLREQCIRTLFTDPQILFFINFFIKNGFHGTIYTFKNYFVTVFFSFSFQFSAVSKRTLSKKIFKCVNNTVGPIFNEKIDKKWNLWVHEQCTDALFT